MGYYSQVVIAIDKDVYLRDLLIENIFPNLLREYSPESTATAMYWLFEDIKWYDTDPDIVALHYYFGILEENGNGMNYGGLRLGEDTQDEEYWGSPHDFEIHLCRTIENPIGYTSKI